MKRRFAMPAGLLLLLFLPAGRLSAMPQDELSQTPAPRAASTLVVPEGTPLALVLLNAVSTRTARPGQPVFLELLVPIIVDDRIAIPAGSRVQGRLAEVRRRGLFTGRELRLQLDRLILPNGYSLSFESATTGADTGGNESVTQAGKIRSRQGRGSVVAGTLSGAGVGLMMGTAVTFGGSGKAMAFGAGAGAGIGLLVALADRGREVELPRGTVVEANLTGPLVLDAARVNFTDIGHATTLAPPPHRRPRPNHPALPLLGPWL